MSRKIPDLWNLNQIAERLDVGPWRVRYVITSRRHIKPAVVLPTMRLFDEKAVKQIKTELELIDTKPKKQFAPSTP
ncbi:MAG: hypothetical protein V3T84_12395 [Phycisphaerales bacterium]